MVCSNSAQFLQIKTDPCVDRGIREFINNSQSFKYTTMGLNEEYWNKINLCKLFWRLFENLPSASAVHEFFKIYINKQNGGYFLRKRKIKTTMPHFENKKLPSLRSQGACSTNIKYLGVLGITFKAEVTNYIIL